MHWLEFLDVMFLVKCLKNRQNNPDICSFVTFAKSCTRAFTIMKLQHNFCHLSTTRHFDFNRIVLLWNALPPVHISQSFLTISVDKFWPFWEITSKRSSLLLFRALFTLYALVLNVTPHPTLNLTGLHHIDGADLQQSFLFLYFSHANVPLSALL